MANFSVARLKAFQIRAQEFLDEKGALFEDEAKLTPSQKLAHFVILVFRSFARNRCPVRAGALSYTTILALIPLLAVGISVASSLLKQKGEAANEQLFTRLIDGFVAKAAPQLGVVPKAPGEENDSQKEAVKRINQFINNIQSGAIGVTGMLALVLVAISLLATIEATFNDMWGITQGRSWYSRIVQYWAGITLGPLLIAVALTLSTGPHLKGTKAWVDELPFLGTLIFALTPFLVVILGFMLFYYLMPNTKVQWKAALAGGIVGGCLWQLNNALSILFISNVITYKEIYKSFAIVPVFMFGLYVSWLIVLFGAQVAYAFQNRLTYIQEKQAEKVNQRGREFVALRLMTFIGQRFQRGEKAATVGEMVEELGVSGQLASQVLYLLVETKLLQEVKGPDHAYSPARPLEAISAQDILHALRAGQGNEPATKEDPVRPLVRSEFERIEQAQNSAAAAVTLRALVEQAQAVENGKVS